MTVAQDSSVDDISCEHAGDVVDTPVVDTMPRADLAFSGVTRPLLRLLDERAMPRCLISVFAYGSGTHQALRVLRCLDDNFLGGGGTDWVLPRSLLSCYDVV